MNCFRDYITGPGGGLLPGHTGLIIILSVSPLQRDNQPTPLGSLVTKRIFLWSIIAETAQIHAFLWSLHSYPR